MTVHFYSSNFTLASQRREGILHSAHFDLVWITHITMHFQTEDELPVFQMVSVFLWQYHCFFFKLPSHPFEKGLFDHSLHSSPPRIRIPWTFDRKCTMNSHCRWHKQATYSHDQWQIAQRIRAAGQDLHAVTGKTSQPHMRRTEKASWLQRMAEDTAASATQPEPNGHWLWMCSTRWGFSRQGLHLYWRL